MNFFLKAMFFAAVLLTGATAIAQLKKTGITLGVSAFYANPKNEFKDLYKGGVGAEVKGGIGLGKTYLVASVGYGAFAAQSNNRTGTLTYVPVKLGLKQYFLAKRIFINGDLGVATLKTNATSAENLFTGDIGGGIRLLGMEAGIYYNSTKSIHGSGSWKTVEYKLGYNFTL